MHTLATIKGSEVRLREAVKNETVLEFKADVKYAYKLVRARRRLLERKAGIISQRR